jgi:hypothetical protein
VSRDTHVLLICRIACVWCTYDDARPRILLSVVRRVFLVFVIQIAGARNADPFLEPCRAGAYISHKRTAVSHPDVASRDPSGLKATLYALWLTASARSCFQVAVASMRTV